MLDVLKRQKYKFLYYILVLGVLIGVVVIATLIRNDTLAVVGAIVLLIDLYVFINALDHYLKNAGSLRLIEKAGAQASLDDLGDHALSDYDFQNAPAGLKGFSTSRIICGRKAFVSDTRGLTVLPYQLIGWVYPQHSRVYGSRKLANFLMIRTVDGQSFDIGIDSKEEGEFLEVLRANNPDLLDGYSKENRQRYRDICRQWKNRRK